jgi:hypothetical protein
VIRAEDDEQVAHHRCAPLVVELQQAALGEAVERQSSAVQAPADDWPAGATSPALRRFP